MLSDRVEQEPACDRIEVLVISARAELGAAVESMLDPTQYHVTTARTGRDALSRLLEQETTVMLLDVALARDGLATAKRLGQHEASRAIPTIFLASDDADAALLTKSYELGAADVLKGPLDPLLLRAKVAVLARLQLRILTARDSERALREPVRVRSQDALRLRGAEPESSLDRRCKKAVEQRVLARASEILLQDDHATSLARLAQVAVPDLAEASIVDLVDLDAAVDLPSRRFVAHRDEARARELGALFESEPFRLFLYGRASSEKLPRCALELSASPGYDELPLSMRRKLRSLGLESAISVPLRARGGHAGWMTWLGARTRVLYATPHVPDVPLAEELGRRVALALQNACLRQDAERAERARDEFLSIASHELRTPLTPLQIQLQRLLGMRGQNGLANLPPEQLRSMLARAVLQVGRISSLVDNVLDVSRIKSGRLRLQAEDVDLTALARKVIARFGNSFAAAGCVVSFDASHAVVVSCDKARIEQVLGNLIGNALKYGAGRPITIDVEASASAAMLRVRDQGVGIAEDRLRAIFERFERASDHRTYGGLGLGLYVVHEIVSAHGGTIAVQSELGRGSTFTVELPRGVANEAPSSCPPSVPPQGWPSTSRSILVVEDDADIRECIRDLLVSRGHRVETAANGWDALERLRSVPSPELILLDLMMPVMDGFHFRSEQRKAPELAGIPVVVLSGDNNVRERARELGAQGFMTKPPNVEELLLVLDRIFDTPKTAPAERAE